MASRQLPSVSLIVLNWNGRHHLEPCLTSLLELDYPANRLELIVCDNGSTDGSAELVEARFPRCRLVRLERNHGFAEGNNLAAAQACGEWLGFLNNDMRVGPSWLRDLLGALDDHPQAACLASRIKNWDGSAIDFIGGGVNYQGHGFQVDYGRASSLKDVERRVLFACGGAMLVRRDVFFQLGGFDRDYFAFYEDVDLGWRLNLLGHEVWYTPRATAFHRHHGTAGSMPMHKLLVLYERNALFTIYKCFERETLDRVLPTALLLLNERALAHAGHDPRAFRIQGPLYARPASVPHDHDRPELSPLSTRARRVLREQGPGAALWKAGRLILRKARSGIGHGLLRLAGSVRPRSGAEPGEGQIVWPAVAASHYAAVSEFAHSLESLEEKRCWLQQRRCVSDRDLIPLFVDPFFPTYTAPEYLRFYRWLTWVRGLEGMFSIRRD